LDTLLTALIKLFDREDSKELMKVWFDAIDLLDSATTDIDLLPPKQLSEERLELPSVAKKRDIWRQNWLDEFDKQIAEEAAIKKALDKGETPTVDFSDLSDFGLHYNTKEEINFTLDCISFLENYGILPGVGGLEDQDRKRVHDMTILRRVMGWRRYLHQYGGLYEVSEDEGFVALDTL
jgi:hypothetical protein